MATLFATTQSALAIPPVAPARTISQRMTVDGLPRSYLLHLPPGYDASTRLPLVIAFHGLGMTADQMMALTNLNPAADASRFIVVYPQGVRDRWNDGALGTPAERRNIDDIHFISTLIASLQQRYAIDPRAIVATGFSNGAFLVHQLACQPTTPLTAIVPVAGTMTSAVAHACRPDHPVKVVAFHGTSDPIVDFSSGVFRNHPGMTVTPVEATSRRWARINHCSTSPKQASLPERKDDGTQVMLERYTDCAANGDVETYVIMNGGHTWPGEARS